MKIVKLKRKIPFASETVYRGSKNVKVVKRSWDYKIKSGEKVRRTLGSIKKGVGGG